MKSWSDSDLKEQVLVYLCQFLAHGRYVPVCMDVSVLEVTLHDLINDLSKSNMMFRHIMCYIIKLM